MLCHCWNVTYTKLVHETTVFRLNCPLISLVGLRGKANFWHHRRSSATSGRWVSLPLPPSVGQRGRPRVAGGERNTTPRQRKGGLRENTKWVSEWKKKKSVPENERSRERTELALEGFFVLSLSLRSAAAVLTVGEEERGWWWWWRCGGGIDHATSFQQTGWTFRLVAFRCSRTDRRRHDSLQTSTCAIQTRATGFRPRGSGQLFSSEAPLSKTNTAAQKFFQHVNRRVEIKTKKLMWS